MIPSFNPMDLTNRYIMVTGASSGIGRGTAILLSKLGAKLILVARREDALQETASLLTGNGHRVEPFDLSQIEQIDDWLKTVSSGISLNGLVHSAGLQQIRPLRQSNNDMIHNMMTINFSAGYSLVRSFRHKKIRAESSSIVFVSSIAGLRGGAGNSVYAATKGALISATRSLALELVRDNIRINCVAPALVKTDVTDQLFQTFTDEQYTKVQEKHLLGIGTVEDVANSIAFLLADTGRWITGTTLVLDGGYTIS